MNLIMNNPSLFNQWVFSITSCHGFKICVNLIKNTQIKSDASNYLTAFIRSVAVAGLLASGTSCTSQMRSSINTSGS